MRANRSSANENYCSKIPRALGLRFPSDMSYKRIQAYQVNIEWHSYSRAP